MMQFDWDEGPDVGGPHAPYTQSERLAIYHPVADDLLARGLAYRCFCSSERLEEVNAAKRASKQPPGYDRHCRALDPAERAARHAAGEPSVVRLQVPLEGETVLHDALRGPIVFNHSHLNDPVILKSDGFPTYALAAIVDDHAMEITHVLRGDEWIPTSPYHVLIYQFMGWEQPVWVHVPQVLGADGKKLSKRHGATAINEFIEQGYLVEALTNCLALVGWGYDETTEIMTRDELIERFSIEHISPNGGVFSHDKLNWFNGQHIRRLTTADLAGRVVPFLQRAGLVADPVTDGELAYVTQLMPLIQERLVVLSEAPEFLQFFFRAPTTYNAADLVPKKLDAAAAQELLHAAERTLTDIADWSEATLETTLRGLSAELGVKTGDLFMALRVAATGSKISPPLFETLHAIGKDETLRRLAAAAGTLNT